MADQSPLIVSMTVEAFVVNDHVRTGGGAFLRTQMAYNALHQAGNAQPGLSDNDTGFTSGAVVQTGTGTVTASSYYNGVYLKWRLPGGLTRGVQDNVAGTTNFPCVPNRWLVVRNGGPLSARTSAAWLVESDYAWPGDPSAQTVAGVGSVYVRPASGADDTPVGMYMGRSVPLGSWTEPGTSARLTAQGPGNPAFAFYQPHCNNVFSFVDTLDGQPAQALSYMVLGWYSAPGDDPLAAVAKDGLPKVLASLGWEVPPGTDDTLAAGWSLLYGTVGGVQWQTAALPGGGAPHATPVSVALGNTSVEALTALVTAQAAAQGEAVDAELLEALQLDMLDVLDEPDGAARLAEKLHASFFGRYGGGYGWEIVDAPHSAAVDAAELAREAAWLATLNQAQAALDDARRTLASLQQELYVAWWKYVSQPWQYRGSTGITGLDDQQALLSLIDPGTAGSLGARTAAQAALVKRLAAAVPTGDTPQALNEAIEVYTGPLGLPESRILKRTAAPTYALANDPVVLIAGAGASGIVRADGKVLCRFPSQLVTGVTCGGTTYTASGLSIPLPPVAGVSGAPWSAALADALAAEFFLTDPQNAGALLAAGGSCTGAQVQAAMAGPGVVGTYPAGAVQAWTENPWHPLLLLWEVRYYPIEYGTPHDPAWSFANGRYGWKGDPSTVLPDTSLAGVIQLTDAAVFNMNARLTAFLRNNPGLDPREAAELQSLQAMVQAADAWDLLGQGLNGFNEQLRLGMAGVFLSPRLVPAGTDAPTTAALNAVAGLLAGVDAYPPALPPIPRGAAPPSTFLPWRSGQFVFVNLVVVDEWGQALWPIDSTNDQHVRLFIPPELTPVQASPAVPFTVAAGPAIAGLSPAVASAGAGPIALAVQGAGFGTDAAVQWNGTALATTVVSATQLAAQLPAALLAAAGRAAVTVASAGATSPGAAFTVAAGPAIGSLSPALVQAGMASAAQVAVTIQGAGFAAGSAAAWNGTAVPTEVMSGTELVAQVPANLLAAPCTLQVVVTSGGAASAPAAFTVSAGAAIAGFDPPLLAAGSGDTTLTVNGAGFDPLSVLTWNGAPLQTTWTSGGEMAAVLPATLLRQPGTASVAQQVGASVVAGAAETVVQLPPALLQPARVDFPLISAAADATVCGPANPEADPVCGWVLPNHLDGSLMAYGPRGDALGELAVGISGQDQPTVCWTPAPGGPFATPAGITLPHIGPFLDRLGRQTPQTFRDFLRAVDETLWSTVPMGAVFDQSLAVLVGRPLALVRARVQLLMDGPPYADPSWQYTFAPAAPAVAGFEFAVELGNVAQLDDGLIGYFTGDDYTSFSVVQQSAATADGYLRPIGADDNYLYLPFDGATQRYVSMLVDPRGPVHATTGILPTVSSALPPALVRDALAAMDVTFRVNGILTDQRVQAGAGAPTTVLMPVPAERAGTWTWAEEDAAGAWTPYPTAPNDTAARLSNTAPVLRRGMLQLSAALGGTDARSGVTGG